MNSAGGPIKLTALALQGLMVDNVEALLAYVDVGEVYQFVNATYARWFGLAPSDMVGKTLETVVGRRAYETIKPHFRRACSGHATYYEAELFEGASRRFCQGNYTPHFDEGGAVIGVFVLVTDITHRYDAEFALRESEQKFQTAFDHAMIGMALMSPRGRYLQVNRSLCEILDYSEAELLQLNVWDITHCDDHDRVELEMDQLLSGGMPVIQVERRWIHKSGRLVDVQLSGLLLRYPDGSPLHFVLQIQDISARKNTERLKSEFVSTVSHELRTPLTSISGALGLMAGGAAGDLPVGAARLIAIAQSNSNRLLRLINDILDIEKIGSGSMLLVKTPVHLRGLARRAMEAMRGYTEGFAVRLRLDDGPSPRVVGDDDRLMQVVTNLLSNAIKFSPVNGEVELRVDVVDSTMACFSVRDYGPGVPESFHDRIFSKFAQADASDTRQRGGTGLGLAIAKEIVEQHGGRIWFDSPPGQGAVFHITLPTYADPTYADA